MPNDTRMQYAHQSVIKSTGGDAADYKKDEADVLYMNHGGYIFIDADAGVADEQVIGRIGIGVTVEEVVNLEALTSGTANVDLPAYRGQPGISLVAAAILTTVGEIGTPPDYVPLQMTRPVSVTISGGTPGETTRLRIKVVPDKHIWR